MVDIVRRIGDLINDVIGRGNGPGQEKRKKQEEKDDRGPEGRKKIPVEKEEGRAAQKNSGAAEPSLQAQSADVGVQPVFTFLA
jgi:hypothetical protein